MDNSNEDTSQTWPYTPVKNPQQASFTSVLLNPHYHSVQALLPAYAQQVEPNKMAASAPQYLLHRQPEDLSTSNNAGRQTRKYEAG
jgi:hypothetical protein